MENKNNVYQVTLDHNALAYFQSNDGDRISRMEAYRILLQKAVEETRDQVTIAGTTVCLSKGQFPTTISELAKELKWNRVSVRQFLRQLRELHLAQICHYGKFEVITMDYADGSSERPRLFSEWEQTLTRWLCGYISIENMVEEAVRFMGDTDFIYGPRMTDGDASNTGMRIHKLVSHLILNYTDIMPYNDDVVAALAKIFNDYCHHDFSEFWLLVSTYMIDRYGTGLWAKGLLGNPPIHVTDGFPQEVKQLLEAIADYYVPYITHKTKDAVCKQTKTTEAPKDKEE